MALSLAVAARSPPAIDLPMVSSSCPAAPGSSHSPVYVQSLCRSAAHQRGPCASFAAATLLPQRKLQQQQQLCKLRKRSANPLIWGVRRGTNGAPESDRRGVKGVVATVLPAGSDSELDGLQQDADDSNKAICVYVYGANGEGAILSTYESMSNESQFSNIYFVKANVSNISANATEFQASNPGSSIGLFRGKKPALNTTLMKPNPEVSNSTSLRDFLNTLK